MLAKQRAPEVSPFREAVSRLIDDVSSAQACVDFEDHLRCPKCPAMNRPGARLIRLVSFDRAECDVCATPFNPSTGERL